jgi:hypothetical protein
MTGDTQEDYAKMMLGGGRSVEGNRSRSGQNKPAPLIGGADKGITAKSANTKPPMAIVATGRWPGARPKPR